MSCPPLGVPPIPIDRSMLPTPPEWNPSVTGLPISLPKYAEGYQPLRKLNPLVRQHLLENFWPPTNRATPPSENENFVTSP